MKHRLTNKSSGDVESRALRLRGHPERLEGSLKS